MRKAPIKQATPLYSFQEIEPRYLAVVFLLYQERLTVKKPQRAASPRSDKCSDFSRIRCPLCNWQPNPAHRWFCAPCDYPEFYAAGCGASWNTFSTRGRCPGCDHQWRWTACLNCAGWSRHEEWYENESKN